jgi:putative transposase
MARHNRIRIPGLIHHVMSRGNGKMQIFLDDVDYRKFVFLLGDILDDTNVECLNYSVMPNHYHLALRPTKTNLSEAMRRLNGEYAQWWNARHNRVGHAFQGRYKDQVVQREGYFMTLCRYIALNPVRANLVTAPELWPWSSYAATIGLRPAATSLFVAPVLNQFGDGPLETLQSRYADYVLGGPAAPEIDDRIRSKERIIGGTEFKRRFKPAPTEAPNAASNVAPIVALPVTELADHTESVPPS